MRQKIHPWILGAALPWGAFAAVALAMNAPLLLSSVDQIINTYDIKLYFLWLHQYTRDALLLGRIPLWNPFIYAGVPFAANPQTSVFYPLSWAHLFMPVAQGHKWIIVLHEWLAASFAFLFLRRIGARPLAALVGALPYAFGGFFMANAAVGHLTVLATSAWMPLALYFAERFACERRRFDLALAGATLGVQALAGEPQTLYYTGLFVSGYLLIRLAPPWRELAPRAAAAFAVRWAGWVGAVGAVALGLGAIQLLPSLEFSARSDRVQSGYAFAANLSMGFGGLSGFFLPWSQAELAGLTAFGRWPLATWNWELSCYAGLATLILAGASFRARSTPQLWAIRAMALAALVLMLGSNTPLYRPLHEFLPGLKLFRVPVRAQVMLQLCLGALSALGLEAILQSAGQPWRAGRLAWGVAGLQVAIVGASLAAAASGSLQGVFVRGGDGAGRSGRARLAAALEVGRCRALGAGASCGGPTNANARVGRGVCRSSRDRPIPAEA